ncbi:uncharacterized protein LOC141947257 [Strix uralensis]|uniref:uncharacterized protein LOC141947257 n=1 Tax=Strix uralensis TaxID=36305 RepID=UPI003DA3288D
MDGRAFGPARATAARVPQRDCAANLRLRKVKRKRHRRELASLSAASTAKVFVGVDWGQIAAQLGAKAGKVPFEKCKVLLPRVAKKRSTPASSVKKVKQQQQLPLHNHGVFSSTPSPSPELSVIKLERFRKAPTSRVRGTEGHFRRLIPVLVTIVTAGGSVGAWAGLEERQGRAVRLWAAAPPCPGRCWRRSRCEPREQQREEAALRTLSTRCLALIPVLVARVTAGGRRSVGQAGGAAGAGSEAAGSGPSLSGTVLEEEPVRAEGAAEKVMERNLLNAGASQ